MRGSTPARPASAPTSCRHGCRSAWRSSNLEAQISPLPPVVLGGLVVVPAGLLAAMTGRAAADHAGSGGHPGIGRPCTRIVMEVERGLGFEPTDREFEKLGYDIESRDSGPAACASSR